MNSYLSVVLLSSGDAIALFSFKSAQLEEKKQVLNISFAEEQHIILC